MENYTQILDGYKIREETKKAQRQLSRKRKEAKTEKSKRKD